MLFFYPLVPCTGKEGAFHFGLILEEALRTKKDIQEESLKESLAWVSPLCPLASGVFAHPRACCVQVQVSPAMVLVEGRPCV